MIPRVPRAMTEGTVASPSSPSVRLTALEVAIITRTQNGTAQSPIVKSGFL